MRLIHTSDWHVGRSFHGAGLGPAHAAYLDHLVEVVRSEDVDAVLVSGDLYDRALPSPDAVSLLSEGLTRLVDAGAQVVVSTGNHDSAPRLGFASALLEAGGLHIRSHVSQVGRPVLVGDVAVYPLPWLDPASVSVAAELGTTTRSHTAVLRAAMDRVRTDMAGRDACASVVMAHCFAAGAADSESERDISVGGVGVVPTDTFAGVSYAALGHLHRPQEVAEGMRYAGSPVPMSFGEAGQVKGSLLLDVDRSGRVEVTTVEAPVHRRVASVRGTIEDLLGQERYAEHEDAWLQVTLTDDVRPRGAFERLTRRFPHLLHLDFEPARTPATLSSYRTRTERRTALDVCCGFVEDVRGTPASPPERELLRDGLEHGSGAVRDREDTGRRVSRRGAA